jgi:hypothetical protein
MKKFIFTAIAMVAFSGISMASTLEVQTDLTPPKSCEDKAISFINDLYPDQQYYNSDQIIQIGREFLAYLEGCQGGLTVVE